MPPSFVNALANAKGRKEPGLARPFFLEQPHFDLEQPRIRERVTEPIVPVLFVLSSFVKLDELAAPCLREPHLLRADREVFVRVEGAPVDGAQHREVDSSPNEGSSPTRTIALCTSL